MRFWHRFTHKSPDFAYFARDRRIRLITSEQRGFFDWPNLYQFVPLSPDQAGRILPKILRLLMLALRTANIVGSLTKLRL